jgi:arginyl-tRNA synthetase
MEELKQAIAQACKDLFNVDIEPELTRPDEQFGDYATNVALQLGKKLNKNPREVAQAVAERLSKQAGIQAVDVAGPGFINFTLTDTALWDIASSKPAGSLAGKTVVAEYSDPNPFKVLHAGHLYTSLVGDAIAKLLESAGAIVKRVNFGGDVGLHVGKTMWAVLQELGGENPDGLSDIEPASRLDWVSACYIKGNEAYEKNEQAKAAIIELNKRVYQLHEDSDHESAFAQIYWTCRQWSYDGFDQLYEALGMTPFDKYYPESVTTPLGIKTVKEGLKKGIFEESEGAVVFKGEDLGLHTRVFLTSAGLPTYETKDLGLAQRKWLDYRFDLGIMVTGNDIIEYMKVVLAALKHFHPEIAERTKHLTHGMIKLAGGVKMSSRRGNILRAADVLDAAKEANKKLYDSEDGQVVLAAVKYAFLKNRVGGGDVIYDPEESVSLQGNSGPYLQYAHARARSILGKAQSSKLKAQSSPQALEAGERSLLRKISEYPEVVNKAVSELMPHHICTYLYELAQVFNHFYEHNRVIGGPREALRLQLVSAYADALKNGLDLLNIPAPERM